MTQEDFDKTRWSLYDSYSMETDQFQLIFADTCNCIPKITKIIKSKVRNGKSLWRSKVLTGSVPFAFSEAPFRPWDLSVLSCMSSPFSFSLRLLNWLCSGSCRFRFPGCGSGV